MTKPKDIASALWSTVLFAVGLVALLNGVTARTQALVALGAALVGAALILLRSDDEQSS